jgi:uncharacterized cupin superfamily protein
VGVKKVNILSVELDEPLDEAGFRHVATSVGARLGARRIGAGVYQAEAGAPIWPYHYHHGIEEWLHVIAGAPVLREPAGERVLTPGDLVCCRSEPVAIERERESSPPRPAVNALALRGRAQLGPQLGADRLDATVVDLDPGEESEPYHYVYGREEWLLVLAGTPTLRHPRGEDRLEAGDLVCLPEGPAGARRLLNGGASVVRALCLSTTSLPANVCYPDTGRWLIRNGPGADEVVVHE